MRDPDFFDDRSFVSEVEDEDLAPPRRDIWQRLSQLMVVCLFVLVLAGILRIFWPEIQRHRVLSAEVERLETIRDGRLARVAELQRQNEWLLTDPQYLESVARDRLNMAHAHETVIRIDRESEARALEKKRERKRQKEMEENLAAVAEGREPVVPTGQAEAGGEAGSGAAVPAREADGEDPDVAAIPNTDLPSPRARVVDLNGASGGGAGPENDSSGVE